MKNRTYQLVGSFNKMNPRLFISDFSLKKIDREPESAALKYDHSSGKVVVGSKKVRKEIVLFVSTNDRGRYIHNSDEIEGPLIRADIIKDKARLFALKESVWKKSSQHYDKFQAIMQELGLSTKDKGGPYYSDVQDVVFDLQGKQVKVELWHMSSLETILQHAEETSYSDFVEWTDKSKRSWERRSHAIIKESDLPKVFKAFKHKKAYRAAQQFSGLCGSILTSLIQDELGLDIHKQHGRKEITNFSYIRYEMNGRMWLWKPELTNNYETGVAYVTHYTNVAECVPVAGSVKDL